MFENIKTDIIYYSTNTDFELEFNLCGCCRMRLLSDKCADKKELVHSLARAVSRSRVIIITAPLFGKENVTQIVAEAIGSATEPADNKEYGIKSDDNIEIIKNSTPLVTGDGYFGGCIIESGPQTMILLTDNKNVRKEVMKNLIHPYIAELYALELKGDTKTQEEQIVNEQEPEKEPELSEEEPLVAEDEADEPQAQPVLIVDEDEPNTQEEILSEEDLQLAQSMVLEDTDDDEQPQPVEEDYDNIYDDLFVEPTKLNRRTVERYTAEYTYAHQTGEDYLTDDEDYYSLKPKSGINFNILMLIISIILLLTIAILCFCIFYIPSKSGVNPSAYLQDIFSTLFV